MENKLSHFDENGNAVMVDVSDKPVTHRTAVATGSIQVGTEIMERLTEGTVAKGDVLGVARVAGIMSVKHTSDLVPMCHPLPVTKCTVDFELEKEKGIIRTFCTVKTDGKTGVEMEALTGVQVTLQQNNMGEFLSEINWTPLWISMKTGVVATIIAFFLGVFCARKIMKLKPGARAIMDGILTMPLVLPPTVAGFCLLLLFSLKRPFGKFLLQNFDIKVVQTWTGCVIAASVIAFPLMYRNARAAFEQVDVNLIYAGRTLGMSESRIFWKVIMPAAGPGIASGTVLAFARAIGEYGATSMLAGNILGKTRTVSVAIASETAAGNFDMAGFWVVVIILISFLVVAAINIVSGRGMQTRRWI